MFGSQKKDKYNYGSVEVNLVPDVKFEFIRAEIVRSRITTIAVLTVVASVTVVALVSLITFGLQNYLISSTDNKIKEQFEVYKNYDGVNQILTVQNQLSKIGQLHQDKPISSRLFNMMVSVIDGSGNSARISRIDFDTETSEIKIEGQSKDGFIGLERLQKSIIATVLSYKENEADEPTLVPMTDKVLTNEPPVFGQDVSGSLVLMFNISFVADSVMFDFNKDVTLIGPSRQDVTDSTIVISKDIFAPKTDSSKDKDEAKDGQGEE